MLYYYYLMRFNISYRLYNYNRLYLDKICRMYMEDRRRLRVLNSK